MYIQVDNFQIDFDESEDIKAEDKDAEDSDRCGAAQFDLLLYDEDDNWIFFDWSFLDFDRSDSTYKSEIKTVSRFR